MTGDNMWQKVKANEDAFIKSSFKVHMEKI